MKKETIYVENIKCGGCMSSIKDTLQKIEGVEQVQISKEDDKVEVSGINVDRNTVIDKLTKLGYPEKGNNSTISKVKSYLSCAIGNLNSN
jgi:copper chaperone CopZ